MRTKHNTPVFVKILLFPVYVILFVLEQVFG